jgi:hypothetical protein
MAFDPTNTHVEIPNPIQVSLLRQEILPLLQERLSNLQNDQVRSPDVILYLCLYLEHRVEGEKKGRLRKELLLELLNQYYNTPELQNVLSQQVDFICDRHLVKKNNVLVRMYKIFCGWLNFKFR